MHHSTVVVTIVTFNRSKYLLKLLEAINNQTYQVDTIIIVDNASTDGTFECLKTEGYVKDKQNNLVTINIHKGVCYQYYYSSINTGGAGGFYKALDLASKQDFSFVWIMDDDVLPEEDCLETLLKLISNESEVVIPNRGDGNYVDYAIQKYNLSNPFFFRVNQCKRGKINSQYMKEDKVFVEDMSFEGPIISKRVFAQIGLPNKDYYILFDDTEYAQRILPKTKITFAKYAVLHKQIIPPPSSRFGWKTYYSIRNAAYFDSIYGKNWMVRRVRPFLRMLDLILRAIVKLNWGRIKWIIRAHINGIKGKLGNEADCEILKDA